MATIALFVALGGSSFAAIKISGGQIKNHTISGKKLRRNTLGGGQIKESKLGTVPNAKHAGAADSATFAATAGTAGSASLLGGLGPSAFERSDSVTSFGPLRDTATTIGPRFSFGPYSVELLCRNLGTNDILGLQSSEPHTVVDFISGAAGP